MTLPVAFHRAARAEVLEAAAWYESRQASLGVDFIAEIERCVTLAANQPLLFSVVHNGIRRVLTKRFPYSVYYRLEPAQIVVLAIFHSSRNPSIWKRRS